MGEAIEATMIFLQVTGVMILAVIASALIGSQLDREVRRYERTLPPDVVKRIRRKARQ